MKIFCYIQKLFVTGLYLGYTFTTIRTFTSILSYLPFYLSTNVIRDHPYKHDYISKKFFTYWLPHRYKNFSEIEIIINKRILITIVLSWIFYTIVYILSVLLKIFSYFLDKTENLFMYKFYLFIHSVSTKLLVNILSLNLFSVKNFVKTIFSIIFLYTYKIFIIISISIYLSCTIIYHYIIHDNWKKFIHLFFNYILIIIGACALSSIKFFSHILFKTIILFFNLLFRVKIIIILYILYLLGFNILTFFDIIYYAYALWIPEEFLSNICNAYLDYYFDDLWSWYIGIDTFNKPGMKIAYIQFYNTGFFQELKLYTREYNLYKELFFDDLGNFKIEAVLELLWEGEIFFFVYDFFAILPDACINIISKKLIYYKWFSPLSIVYNTNFVNWLNFLCVWNLILHVKFCVHLYLGILWKVLMPQYIFSKLAYIYFYHLSTITYTINKFLYISNTFNIIYLTMIHSYMLLYPILIEIFIICYEIYFTLYNIIFLRIVLSVILFTIDNFPYFLWIFIHSFHLLVSETINWFIIFDIKDVYLKPSDPVLRMFLILHVYSKHYLDIILSHFRISTIDILNYFSKYERPHCNQQAYYFTHFDIPGVLYEYNNLLNVILGHTLYQGKKFLKFFAQGTEILMHYFILTLHSHEC